MDINNLKITKKFVSDIVGKIEQSNQIAIYYNMLAAEEGSDTLFKISERMQRCGHSWFFDKYIKQGIKDLQYINFCGNKFCFNCQKQLQATRLKKFFPEIKKLMQDYDIYHVVFTVPNCSAYRLRGTIKKMLKVYPYIIRYFKGDAKIAGEDFLQYGYIGSIRSLEVTYKNDNEYHPHLHCIFVMKKNLNLVKTHKNKFTHNWVVEKKRLFSDLEILLQKVWYLRLMNQKVNLKSLKKTKDGFSCTMDLINSQKKEELDKNVYEVFKYATKGYDKNKQYMDYMQFKTLHFALRCRTIQGYGVFRKMKFDDKMDMSANAIYDEVVEMLQRIEKPVSTSSSIFDLAEEFAKIKQDYIYITRKIVWQMLMKGEPTATPESVEVYATKVLAEVAAKQKEKRERIILQQVHDNKVLTGRTSSSKRSFTPSKTVQPKVAPPPQAPQFYTSTPDSDVF